MTRLDLPALCLVTDRRRCLGRSLEEVVAAALDGGVGMVQLREKDLPSGQLLVLANRLRALTRGRALLFVNDRVDVALAAEADGVQLGEASMPVRDARQTAGHGLLVGRSVHDVEGAAAAESEGADLLVAGTVFPSESHPGAAVAGTELLERLHRRVTVPFLAIGGVTAGNVAEAMRSGASGGAVITAIAQSNDPAQAARELLGAMRTAWAGIGTEEVARRA